MLESACFKEGVQYLFTDVDSLPLLWNSKRWVHLAQDHTSEQDRPPYETSFVLTKDPAKADLAVRYERDATAGVTVVKELQKVQDKYPFTTKLGIEEVRRRLHRKEVRVFYKGEAKGEFNSFHWDTFVKFYGMKDDPRYAHNRALAT